MSPRTFVDTNVLIYAYDSQAGAKRTIAAQILDALWRDGVGVLSPQILQEFYVNATRKIARPLPKAAARQVVEAYAPWCVSVGREDVGAAFRIEDAGVVNFWDALVIATAVRAGAERLLTEDLNSGEVIAGVRIENPFAATC